MVGVGGSGLVQAQALPALHDKVYRRRAEHTSRPSFVIIESLQHGVTLFCDTVCYDAECIGRCSVAISVGVL